MKRFIFVQLLNVIWHVVQSNSLHFAYYRIEHVECIFIIIVMNFYILLHRLCGL